MTNKDDMMKLAARIVALDQIKLDTEHSKEIREKAADMSFECYEELLRLCEGDTHLVANFLGQKEWFDSTKKRKLP